MSDSLTLKIDDKDVIAMIDRSPKIVKKEVKGFLLKSSVIVDKNWKERAPVGETGKLSIPKVEQKDWQVIIGPSVKYAKYVEYGTRPHWTSARNLAGWANLKGINPYALRNSIAKKGTQANPFINATYHDSLRPIKKLSDRLIAEIARKMGRVRA